MPRIRLLTTFAVLALLSVWTGRAVASPLTSTAHAATKVVRYHGYSVIVPVAWPVYNLDANPSVCVRFNRHAVYLGQPSSRQRCPAHAAGRTEAILIQPLAAHGAGAGGAGAPALPPAANPKAQPPTGSSTALAVPRARVLVTATWQRDPSLMAHALGVRSLATHVASASAPSLATHVSSASAPSLATHTAGSSAPAIAAGSSAPAIAAHTAGGAAAVAAAAPKPRTARRARDPVYTGLGFDACSTPSTAAMSAWGASPYRAVGVYIGGANEACAQRNLSTAWVSQESAAGWALIPIYVSLQAPSNTCGCAPIIPAQATAEGTAAADDALTQAEVNGIAPGNPIYDDMEGYSRTSANTSAVLAFLAAWTSELHAHGYLSGVYSGANSGITDLVAQYGTSYIEPDDIWIALWDGQQTTTSSYVPSSDWANHQRIHQYQGGHNATYGGVTINIDSDYLDAGAASGTVQFPNGTFVQVSGTTTFWEIAGNAPLLVSNWSDVGGVQPYTVITQQQFNALNPVPSNGTLFETQTGAVYVVAGGAPMYVTSVAVFGGTPQPFLVDGWDVDNAGNPTAHLNRVPANGTFLASTTGRNYRVAGGAPIGVTNWSVFGGAQPSVLIDPWDIANIFNPLAHLASRPKVGTLVHGLPSGAYWKFGPKNRFLVPASATAVPVDDHGLVRFSAIPCRVPNLRGMTLAQVGSVLMKADCHLGKVHDRPLIRRRHTLRVTRQIPAPRVRKKAYYTVGITLG